MELDDFLRSWVIPKGPSMDPTQRRLAILVDDYPIEYYDFEGIIPEWYYGDGLVLVWDTGSYEIMEIKEGKINFFLNGKRLKGFTLTILKRSGKQSQWLLIKKKDNFTLPSWKLESCLTPEKRARLRERILLYKTE